MSKETRRIQNADRRAAGVLLEADPPTLAPLDFVPIPMPPICDDDFYFGAPPADDDEDFDDDGQDDDTRREEDEEEEYN